MRLSDAEWTVMQALWERESATARELLAAVGRRTGWAYTTLTTLLGRLAAKGAVAVARDGRARRYQAALSRRAARRSAVRSLLERAFGGTLSPLVAFLAEDETLSREDRAALRALRPRPRKGRGA